MTFGDRTLWILPAAGLAASLALAAGVASMLAGAGPGPEGIAIDPAGKSSAVKPLNFARDVRPILASACYKCHGPDPEARQGGVRLDTREAAIAALEKGGFAVVPGDTAASKLIERITSDDEELRMPPIEVSKHGLAPDQIATLTRWVKEGVNWSTHWSFEPPVERPAPAVKDASWAKREMDRWVLAKLDEEGLKPSPRADAATLIRRVSLDLTGLPPAPTDVQTFTQSMDAAAYDRVVDTLLASPAFGEKWARWWLDLARYADTKGYEKDGRRDIWPYRDWVIKAFNADMPFDRFTEEQLAGDMLANPTEDDLIATAFHRNTMTNDEGGTDNEEFRVAAVIDRVNTTFEVWQGLTMGCAQCHTHKFDPIKQTEYYQALAIFNNTEDADLDPERPFLAILTEKQKSLLSLLDAKAEWPEQQIARLLDRAGVRFDAAIPAMPEHMAEPADFTWIGDLLPMGSVQHVEGLGKSWPWIDAGTIAPASGKRCFGGKVASRPGQQYITDAYPALSVHESDSLFAYVWIDPADTPRQIVLQWLDDHGSWNHRAYWGEDATSYASVNSGTPALLPQGSLPQAGRWVRLEVPASEIDLAGANVRGWAFSQVGGTVYWNNAGIRTVTPPDLRHTLSPARWLEAMRAYPQAAAGDLRPLLEKDLSSWTPQEHDLAAEHFLREAKEQSRLALIEPETKLAQIRAEEKSIRDQQVQVPVMQELAGTARRESHRFVRGSFLNPAETVEPGVPATFSAFEPQVPHSRLELARWLCDARNPLTARVIVNRLWEQLFGAGVVETVEDFGTQGTWPSNPELLDSLAIKFSRGWSIKAILREIVTSATYQQSSDVTDELLKRDPNNRLLARGPRFRLDGEVIRDQALAASGLLSSTMYGQPVFPYQPPGLWQMIYNDDDWRTSPGDDAHRRSVYTFWRRTVPYPSMATFDAPSREVCVSRRVRTNTPLQALVTLNDPVFVEAARGLAARISGLANDDRDRIDWAFELVLARHATEAETSRLVALLAAHRARYQGDITSARQAAGMADDADAKAATELAAWTGVCTVILNLDETLSKP